MCVCMKTHLANPYIEMVQTSGFCISFSMSTYSHSHGLHVQSNFVNPHAGSKKYTHIQDLGSFLTPKNFPLLYIMERIRQWSTLVCHLITHIIENKNHE